jgi:serine/threonine protein kinase
MLAPHQQSECLDEVQWSHFLDTSHQPENRHVVVAHLDSCSHCREMAAALSDSGQHAEALPNISTRYILQSELSHGGMGRIMIAYDRQLHREVALKCLREGVADDGRFAKEVAVLTRLAHPAIVPIVDAGKLAEDFPFFVMPLLVGVPLDQRLRAKLYAEERLTLTQQLLPVVDAVAYAHESGVLHRDLKPHNIFVGSFGEMILLDWGLAKERGAGIELPLRTDQYSDPSLSMDSLTQTGVGVGTPAYASPEQRHGESVDERTDVYGLGAILYHVLGGKPPGTSEVKPLRVLAPGVPKDLAAIVMRALSTESADRYMTARELAADLTRFFSGLLVSARDYSTRERLSRFVGRHRAAVFATLAVLTAVVVSATISIKVIWNERNQATQSRDLALAQKRHGQQMMRYVLDDVRNQYDSLGRLDLMKDLIASVENLRDAAPRGNVLAQTSRDQQYDAYETATLQQMTGDIALAEQRLPEALAAFQSIESSLINTDVKSQSSTDQLRFIQYLCKAQARISAIAMSMGKSDDAHKATQQCSAFIDSTPAPADPESLLRWQDAVIALNVQRADLAQVASPDRARYLTLAQQALPDVRNLPKSNIQMWAHKRLVIEQRLLDYHIQSGHLSEAITLAESMLPYYRAMMTATPSDTTARNGILTVATRLSDLLGQKDPTKERERMLALLQEGKAIALTWSEQDPTNTDVLGDLSGIWGRLGLLATDEKEAIAMQEKSIDVSRRLLRLAPNDPHVAENLATDLYNVANSLLEMRNIAAAAGHCAEIQKLRTTQPSGFSPQYDILALVVCGNVANLHGDKLLARTSMLRAIDIGRKTKMVPLQINHIGTLVAWMEILPPTEARTYAAELQQAIASVTMLPQDQHTDELTTSVAEANKILNKLK